MSNVLNLQFSGFEVPTVIRHAFSLVWRGVTRVYDWTDGVSLAVDPKPRVCELVRFVYSTWRTGRSGGFWPGLVGSVWCRSQPQGFCVTCGGVVITWGRAVAGCTGCGRCGLPRFPMSSARRAMCLAGVPTLPYRHPGGASLEWRWHHPVWL
ncbi:MAG: hypothetical protein LBR27_01520 [Bifidobacteriaceae bacterium]|jgi:hypothetical protein|nr:hypothetical protein [Bifidobacteriaceae bacterium]